MAIGRSFLYYNTTDSYRTGIGFSANSEGAAYDNSTGLGYNADPAAADKVRIGNSSVNSICGQVSFTTL
jgi:hypothetical protein